jgi:hypothetical protein
MVLIGQRKESGFSLDKLLATIEFSRCVKGS